MGDLKREIEEILHQVAKIKQFSNYEVDFDGSGLKGDGFLGEFFFGLINNKDANEIVHVAIKKAFKNVEKRTDMNVPAIYYNEMNFYSTLYPALQQLQNEKNVTKPFNNVAQYYYGKLDEPNETIVLENLKTKGFVIKKKEDLLDDEHAKFIFEIYGRFHALSFALKDQNFELYQKLVANVKDAFAMGASNPKFKLFINAVCAQGFQSLHPEEDAEVIKHCKKYFDDSFEEYKNSMICKEDNSIINHGDCWSNNMMFKYSDSGKLEDMKLVDFQIVRLGTPVHDLSYFFYTGGSKALFDKLDDYLKIYHDSLSKNLRELGSDPEKLYPFKQLKNDWKNYARFGVILSLLLVKVKLLQKKDVDSFVDDKNGSNSEGFINAAINEELFKKRSRDIILSAYKIGAL